MVPDKALAPEREASGPAVTDDETFAAALRGGVDAVAALFRERTVDADAFLRFLKYRRVSISRFFEYLDIVLCSGRPKQEFLSGIRHDTGDSGPCAKPFANNEVVFVCRTCQVDDTCAICSDCFHGGHHEGHDYAMRSVVGGCCDCGDMNAWKKSGDCFRHGRSSHDEDPVSALRERVSTDIYEKLNLVVGFGVNYTCAAISCIGQSPSSNRRFPKIVKASLEWARSVCLFGPAFVRVFCGVLTSPSAVPRLSGQTPLQFLLKLVAPASPGAHGRVKASAIDEPLGKLCVCLLADKRFRAPLLAEIIPLYGSLRCAQSRLLDNIGVQMFTVGSLADDFVHRGVVVWLLRLLHESLNSASSRSTRAFTPRSRRIINPGSRAFSGGPASGYYEICVDLRYMLRHQVVSTDAATSMLSITPLVQIMSLLQCMMPMKRRLDHHIEFESDSWMVAFELECEISVVFRLVAQGLGNVLESMEKPPASGDQSCWRLQHALTSALLVDFADQGLARRMSYDVSKQPVSLHQPLHRGFALLAETMYQHRVDLDFSTESIARDEFFALYAESIVRGQAIMAQVRAGMWVRNGLVAQDLESIYRGPAVSSLALFPDIFGLQLAAANMDIDEFLQLLIERFGLASWVLSEELAPVSSSRLHELVLAEEFLRLVIVVMCDRTPCGLVTEQSVRREIVLTLCANEAGLSHSALQDRLPRRVAEHPKFDAVLNAVSSFVRPHRKKIGMYKLRPELWAEFDPFWPRYLPAELSVAESEYLKVCSGRSPVCLAMPASDCFTGSPVYSELKGLLQSPVLHRFIVTCLRHGLLKSHSGLWSSRICRSILYILTMDAKFSPCVDQPSSSMPMVKTELTESRPRKRLRSSSCTHEAARDPVPPVSAQPSFLSFQLSVGQHTDILQMLIACHQSGVAFKNAENSLALSRLARCLKPFREDAVALLDDSDDDARRREIRRAKARARQEVMLQSFAAKQDAFMSRGSLNMIDESTDVRAAANQGSPLQPEPHSETCVGEDNFFQVLDSATCMLCPEGETSGSPLGMVAYGSSTRIPCHFHSSDCADSTAGPMPESEVTERIASRDVHVEAWQERMGRRLLEELSPPPPRSAGATGTLAGINEAIAAGAGQLRRSFEDQISEMFVNMLQRWSSHSSTKPVATIDFDWRRSSCLHIQSCGHFVHRDCLASYIVSQSTMPQLSTSYFQCPVCRGLSNLLVPLPTHSSQLLERPRSEELDDVDGIGCSEWLQSMPVFEEQLCSDFSDPTDHSGRADTAQFVSNFVHSVQSLYYLHIEAARLPTTNLPYCHTVEVPQRRGLSATRPSSSSSASSSESQTSPAPDVAIITLNMFGSVCEVLDVSMHAKDIDGVQSTLNGINSQSTQQLMQLLLLCFHVSAAEELLSRISSGSGRRSQSPRLLTFPATAWAKLFGTAPKRRSSPKAMNCSPDAGIPLLLSNVFGLLLLILPFVSKSSCRHVVDVGQLAQLSQALVSAVSTNKNASSSSNGVDHNQDISIEGVHNPRTLAAFIHLVFQGHVNLRVCFEKHVSSSSSRQASIAALELVADEIGADELVSQALGLSVSFQRKLVMLLSSSPRFSGLLDSIYLQKACLDNRSSTLLRGEPILKLLFKWIGALSPPFHGRHPARVLRHTPAREVFAAAHGASARDCDPSKEVASLSGLLPSRKFSFVELPARFHELFHRYSSKPCSICLRHRRDHLSVCLLCGRAVCFEESQPCDSEHMKTCGGRDGVFMHLSRCSVVLVNGDAWAYFSPSIYLDDHGEDDIYLDRGLPLHLNERRLADLTSLFVCNGLADYISKVNLESEVQVHM